MRAGAMSMRIQVEASPGRALSAQLMEWPA